MKSIRRKFSFNINLLLNSFPSYSISAWFSTIFIQPRFFGLPFLISSNLKFKKSSWNLLLFLNLLITVFVPLFGLLAGRILYYLDLAYIISIIYTIFFINNLVNNEQLIKRFNKFIQNLIFLNFIYILFQLILFYSGNSQYTMLHSNIPFHVNSGYSIEPGFLEFIPRYTGFWIESGPLTFFLCITFPYLMQRGLNYSIVVKIITFLLILFSQSKFLFIFLPFFVFEYVLITFFHKIHRKFTKPLIFLSFIFILSFVILYLIFGKFDFHDEFSKQIPAYELRLDGLRHALSSFSNFGFFGKGLLPSTIELKGLNFEIQGNDAFSIIFLGYGFYPGLLMILIILIIAVKSKINYKLTFCGVLIFGFLSNGSLIVPQYFFAIIFSILSIYEHKYTCQNYK